MCKWKLYRSGSKRLCAPKQRTGLSLFDHIKRCGKATESMLLIGSSLLVAEADNASSSSSSITDAVKTTCNEACKRCFLQLIIAICQTARENKTEASDGLVATSCYCALWFMCTANLCLDVSATDWRRKMDGRVSPPAPLFLSSSSPPFLSSSHPLLSSLPVRCINKPSFLWSKSKHILSWCSLVQKHNIVITWQKMPLFDPKRRAPYHCVVNVMS